jgi:uncharacterized protein (DUF2141 family)
MNYSSNVPTRLKSGGFRLLISLLFISHLVIAGQPPVLYIKGFKNEKGNAFIRITNKEGKVVESMVKPIQNNEVRFEAGSLKEEYYAIEVFHDENNNQKMDTALLGYPTEAWGVSNNVRPKFRAPAMSEMLINVVKNKTVTIIVK